MLRWECSSLPPDTLTATPRTHRVLMSPWQDKQCQTSHPKGILPCAWPWQPARALEGASPQITPKWLSERAEVKNILSLKHSCLYWKGDHFSGLNSAFLGTQRLFSKVIPEFRGPPLAQQCLEQGRADNEQERCLSQPFLLPNENPLWKFLSLGKDMPEKLQESGDSGLSSPVSQEYLECSLSFFFSCGRWYAGWKKGKGGKPKSLTEPDSKRWAFPF